VARFQWRARRRARRSHDGFSLASATRPHDLAILLRLAGGRSSLAELGTATGWTAISLALAHPHRRVISLDPFQREERGRYLELVAPAVRQRVEFITAPGSASPPAGLEVELLYVDSSHERAETVAEVKAWLPALTPGALIVFDDYGHPAYPGVQGAVDELGLAGRRLGTLFVHTRAPVTGGDPGPQRSAGA
jgi:predicted O-methyltransferase YrrM